jgi:BASS family bile acid:Na+ symporter
LLRRKIVLLTGLAANLLIPLIFILAASQLLRYWHNPGEAGSLIMGLALIASMPIAGSSAAWTQIANGDLALSIGLVTVSTLVSPLTMPLALSLIALLATGQYTAALHHAAEYGAGAFLWIGVVLPSLLGLLVRFALGSRRIEAAMPYLKLVTGLILLLLNYSNAAISLPHVFQHPDPDYIVITLITALSLCLMTFAAAYGLARLLRVDHAQEASLLYGLGMNNNGMGLVLASLTLAEYPRVMLPIIFYNLIQHAVAAGVHSARLRFFKKSGTQPSSDSPSYSNVSPHAQIPRR